MAAEGNTWRPLGILRSPWPAKFGVPRQAGLCEARCRLDLHPEEIGPEALRGLEGFSHLWILFCFHRVPDLGWRSTVRPPRLGGNARMGVLATRSGFRPNRIGLSAVRLLGIEGLSLHLVGGDFVDETPVVDIKPYLPWSDAIADARADWSDAPPPRSPVAFTPGAERQLAEHARHMELRPLIVDTLALDPRPGYQTTPSGRAHGVRILDVDVRFTRESDGFLVREIVRVAD